jgi:hypothetical protein
VEEEAVKYDINPICETYKGYTFRSFLEIRWAVVFSEMGYAWQYEPRRFDMGNGTTYLPDFYIEDLDMWVEIKPIRADDCGKQEGVLTAWGGPKNLNVCDTSVAIRPLGKDASYGVTSISDLMIGDGLDITKTGLWGMVRNSTYPMQALCADYILRMCVVRRLCGKGEWCVIYGTPGERIGHDFRIQGSKPISLDHSACKRGRLIKAPFQC